jgi:hypothetical protein
VARLWAPDRFRLFLSHVSAHKVPISKLKIELANFGVDAFLAHEDIEPTREWRDEIAVALGSMNALVALFTPGFHESSWTDQEIGWALGRGVLVMSVRLGTDPYGFGGLSPGRPLARWRTRNPWQGRSSTSCWRIRERITRCVEGSLLPSELLARSR